MTTPERAMHDLTLALIYLTRFVEGLRKDFQTAKEFKAWKNYDWDTLDKLSDKGLIFSKPRNKSLRITEEGVETAREILKEYGIEDW